MEQVINSMLLSKCVDTVSKSGVRMQVRNQAIVFVGPLVLETMGLTLMAGPLYVLL